MSEISRRIAALLREAREVPGADPQRQAEFFDRKASVLDSIAAEDPSQAALATECADTARAEARRLRRGES